MPTFLHTYIPGSKLYQHAGYVLYHTDAEPSPSSSYWMVPGTWRED